MTPGTDHGSNTSTSRPIARIRASMKRCTGPSSPPGGWVSDGIRTRSAASATMASRRRSTSVVTRSTIDGSSATSALGGVDQLLRRVGGELGLPALGEVVGGRRHRGGYRHLRRFLLQHAVSGHHAEVAAEVDGWVGDDADHVAALDHVEREVLVEVVGDDADVVAPGGAQ